MKNYLLNTWKNWPYKGITYIVLFVIIIIFAALFILRGNKAVPVQDAGAVIPQVQAVSLEDLSKTATINVTTSIQSANSAPLVARLGGRVTAIYNPLGTHVRAGAIVVDIDGGVEANPARVQQGNASIALDVFQDISKQTQASLESSVTIAKNALQAVQATGSIGSKIQAKNKDIAKNAVRQAEASFAQAKDTDNDLVIRSADVAVNAARLAQDQASFAAQLANRQSADAVKQAKQNLASVQISQKQALANLASQQAGLEAQLRSASEQVKLLRVIAPFSGEVSRLSVQVGDFVHPGDIVGEVNGVGTATAICFVPNGVREQLHVGESVDVLVDGQKKIGYISRLASNSGSDTALWQVNITIKESVQPHSAVSVLLPIGVHSSDTVFVPLDAVNVRQSGSVILTVADGVVTEHVFTPIHYYDEFVEGTVDAPLDALVITNGNRTLRTGDHVSVESK